MKTLVFIHEDHNVRVHIEHDKVTQPSFSQEVVIKLNKSRVIDFAFFLANKRSV